MSLCRNPCRNRRKFKLGWRDSYPTVVLTSPIDPTERSPKEEGEWNEWQQSLDDDFPSNEISTTKYSIFSYLFKVLYQEFKKFTSFYFLIITVITSFPGQVLLCASMASVSAYFQAVGVSSAWYLDSVSDQSAGVVGVETFFTYFALISYLLPISLVVLVEVAKVVQGKFMEWDVEMMSYDSQEGEWEGMSVKTFNLNDDLGTIEYVFSDKTGTLTCNEMKFRKCAVTDMDTFHKADEGELGSCYEKMKMRGHGSSTSQLMVLHRFLLCLSLAHSCVAAERNGQFEYRSASPDEEALCDGAASNRFVFLGRAGNVASVEVLGEVQRFEVLYEMEFTSARRRMSIIVRTPDGTVLLLSKGADAEMKQRLSNDDGVAARSIDAKLDAFSADGLRTLMLCHRELSAEQLAEFAEQHYAASTALSGREQAVEQVCDRLERDLLPLGCTGIEDRLQEAVPESISYLLQAGIRIWVITGDKQATAISIGYSTRLLDNEMAVEQINASTVDECRDRLEELRAAYLPVVEDENDEAAAVVQVIREKELALVIDGATLSIVLEEFSDDFAALAQASKSVICCRVTPLQKAEVVRLVKSRTSSICLAIGDGANDVGMIQEAHIGIGIFGREGSEAARSSDYAIREFRHLKRLLCVHGRYALIRNAGISLYSFYKNAAIFLAQVWFGFFNAGSVQTLYDEWIMTFFNIIFTSWPPLIYGCFEKDIDERIIERYPETYARTQKNSVFTLFKLTEWLTFALYHSVVLYFGSLALIDTPVTVMANGQGIGLTTFGQMVMTASILVIFLKLAMETLEWNWIVHLSLWGSLALYPLLVVTESAWLQAFTEQYWVFFNLVSETPIYWLWFIAAVVLCLLPDYMLFMIRNHFFPETWLLLREYYHYHPEELDYPIRANTLRFTVPGELDSTPLLSPARDITTSYGGTPMLPATPTPIVHVDEDD